MQRKKSKMGKTLGKTTGWIHRASLKKAGVTEMTGCKYISISDDGLLIEREGKQEHVDVDTVILCAGQESNNKLFDELNKLAGDILLTEVPNSGNFDDRRIWEESPKITDRMIRRDGEILVARYQHRGFRFRRLDVASLHGFENKG